MVGMVTTPSGLAASWVCCSPARPHGVVSEGQSVLDWASVRTIPLVMVVEPLTPDASAVAVPATLVRRLSGLKLMKLGSVSGGG